MSIENIKDKINIKGLGIQNSHIIIICVLPNVKMY